MDLFENTSGQLKNYLPKDGEVNYYGTIISNEIAEHYFNSLLQSIVWENDQAIVMGKRIITKRKVAWYGDKPFKYTYSHISKIALPWTKELLQLKTLAEQASAEKFNACLLNLYHDGSEGMAWHSDSEREIKKQSAIASISLGAERKFSFKHKHSQERCSLFLQAGSLLVMKAETQSYWLHRLAPSKTIYAPRINLTFRCMHE